ncbi:MAG: rhodanese-like domain-containing protein [Flavipsychrobacter sp.]|nr:rhodanese-like domain-containing protein [Flavipsychrobacter sp.]
MMNIFKSMFGPAEDFKALKEAGAIVLDVRTPAEFQSGHVKGSVNIPLDILNKQLNSLKKEGKAIIAVCRSGNRSAMAVSQLKAAGIEAYNGGAWNSLQRKL